MYYRQINELNKFNRFYLFHEDVEIPDDEVYFNKFILITCTAAIAKHIKVRRAKAKKQKELKDSLLVKHPNWNYYVKNFKNGYVTHDWIIKTWGCLFDYNKLCKYSNLKICNVKESQYINNSLTYYVKKVNEKR
jgi:hypothetical protein